MDEGGRFMYKNRMSIAVSVHERWRDAVVAAAPQILSCTYCVLLRWEHDNLSAPYWRLYWNDRAGAYLLTEKRRIALGPDRVVLVPPHTVFGTGNDGKVGHLYVHFALGLDRAATPGRVFQHRPSPAERGLLRRLVEAIERPPDGAAETPLGASFLVHALVNGALATVPADYWDGRLTDTRITQALQTIGRAGARDGNAALARAAGMHPNAFLRKFTQATGQTPHRYRLSLRVEQAAGWLREGRQSMEEVAAAAGFCDRFHFSRIFKQVMGVSPGRYRRETLAERRE